MTSLCSVLLGSLASLGTIVLYSLDTEAEAGDLELVQEYLVFPAQLHLKTRARASAQNYTIAILDYISSLYKRIRLTSLFLFSDILSSCLALVSVKTSNTVTVTEDLQISICDTLRTMIRASRDSEGGQDDRAGAGVIFTQLLTSAEPSHKLPLSHLVFTGLAWASEDAAPASVVLACLR